jgi:hypothetical protein
MDIEKKSHKISVPRWGIGSRIETSRIGWELEEGQEKEGTANEVDNTISALHFINF